MFFAQKHTAGECVDLLDDYDFPARTIIETVLAFIFAVKYPERISKPLFAAASASTPFNAR